MTNKEVREEVQAYNKAQGWKKVDNVFELDLSDIDQAFLVENKNCGIIGAVTVKKDSTVEYFY